MTRVAIPDKPTLLLDFDGCIHRYSKGWQGGKIYDPPVEGFFEWALEAKKYFRLVIYSTRSDSHKNIKPMKDWLHVHLVDWHWKKDNIPPLPLEPTDFEFVIKKPPALVSIDDRAITFKGDWSAEELKPENLAQFKSWVQKEQDDGKRSTQETASS